MAVWRFHSLRPDGLNFLDMPSGPVAGEEHIYQHEDSPPKEYSRHNLLLVAPMVKAHVVNLHTIDLEDLSIGGVV